MFIPLGVSSRYPWGFFVCTRRGFFKIPLGVFSSYSCGVAPPIPVDQGENDCTTRGNVVPPNHNITIREPQLNQGGGGGGLSCSVHMDFAPPIPVEQCAK